jgi:hypothetical protein
VARKKGTCAGARRRVSRDGMECKGFWCRREGLMIMREEGSDAGGRVWFRRKGRVPEEGSDEPEGPATPGRI